VVSGVSRRRRRPPEPKKRLKIKIKSIHRNRFLEKPYWLNGNSDKKGTARRDITRIRSHRRSALLPAVENEFC